MMTVLYAVIAVYVLWMLVLRAMLMRKAGMRPWLAFIPLVGDYLYHKMICCSKQLVRIILFLLADLLLLLVMECMDSEFALKLEMMGLVYLVVVVFRYYRTSAILLALCFGKDRSFAWGLMLLPPVYQAELALGDAGYQLVKDAEGELLKEKQEESRTAWACPACGKENEIHRISCASCCTLRPEENGGKEN